MLSRLLQKSTLSSLALFAALASLSACGGNSSEPSASAVVVPPPALQVSGVVADGMAWRNAKVQIRCVNGVSEVSANEDGRYDAKIIGASLPCAVQASLADGTKLRSLKIGTDKEVVVNVTPLTELLVVRLAHRDAGQFFDNFNPAQTELTSGQIQSATDEIKKLLKEFVDLSSLSDFVADRLHPSTAQTTSNDPYNNLLQLLKTRLDAVSHKDLLALLTSSAPLPDALPFPISLIVLMPQVEVKENWTFQFTALTVYPAHLQLKRTPVAWSVVEADGGAIDPVTGLYTAPNKSGVYHVKAQSELKPGLSVLVEVRVRDFGVLPFYVNGALNLPAQNVMVRDAEMWRLAQEKFNLKLIGTLPEQIDFNQHMLLIVYHGQGASGCAGVKIHTWQSDTQSQTLEYDLKGNAEPDVMCTASLTYPIKVVMVRRSDLPVNFVERK